MSIVIACLGLARGIGEAMLAAGPLVLQALLLAAFELASGRFRRNFANDLIFEPEPRTRQKTLRRVWI